MASREGKFLIHSAGATRESWQTARTDDFLESTADACKAALGVGRRAYELVEIGG